MSSLSPEEYLKRKSELLLGGTEKTVFIGDALVAVQKARDEAYSEAIESLKKSVEKDWKTEFPDLYNKTIKIAMNKAGELEEYLNSEKDKVRMETAKETTERIYTDINELIESPDEGEIIQINAGKWNLFWQKQLDEGKK